MHPARILAFAALAALLLALLALACGPLHRHSRGSLGEIVERGTLRVGVQEARPWVIRDGEGRPAGMEAELIEGFAKELGVTPQWHWGDAEEHFEALERHDLDVVIGAITYSSPWRRRVSFTIPYYSSRRDIGLVPSADRFADLEGVRVAVGSHSGLARELREEGARIEVLEQPFEASSRLPVAADEWQLEAWGLRPLGVDLGSQRHAMAVPPGENDLLIRLEDYLHRFRPEELGEQLAQAARP